MTRIASDYPGGRRARSSAACVQARAAPWHEGDALTDDEDGAEQESDDVLPGQRLRRSARADVIARLAGKRGHAALDALHRTS